VKSRVWGKRNIATQSDGCRSKAKQLRKKSYNKKRKFRFFAKTAYLKEFFFFQVC
jgi:hypothetical protein